MSKKKKNKAKRAKATSQKPKKREKITAKQQVAPEKAKHKPAPKPKSSSKPPQQTEAKAVSAKTDSSPKTQATPTIKNVSQNQSAQSKPQPQTKATVNASGIETFEPTEKPTIIIMDTENLGYLNCINILSLLKQQDNVILCATPNTPNIPISTIRTMQKCSARTRVLYCRSGRNACDFQIALVMGMFAAKHQNKYAYRIMSKDTGFIPMTKFMCSIGYDAKVVLPPKTAYDQVSYGEFIEL